MDCLVHVCAGEDCCSVQIVRMSGLQKRWLLVQEHFLPDSKELKCAAGEAFCVEGASGTKVTGRVGVELSCTKTTKERAEKHVEAGAEDLHLSQAY